MITVVGASGGVGKALVDRLRSYGVRCRAVTRSAERVDEDALVDAAEGDITDPAFLDVICGGASGLFVVQFGSVDVAALLDRAEAAGVDRVVLVSSLLAETHPGSAIGGMLAADEQTVARYPGAWTILRPWEFMSNTLEWASDIAASGSITIPFLGEPSPAVDSRDIAEVAAAALLHDRHDGQTHPLTGPVALGVHDKTTTIGEVVGRDVQVHVDEQLAASVRAEAPDEVVAGLAASGVSGIAAPRTLTTVREILGTEPRTFERWVTDHADRFRADTVS